MCALAQCARRETEVAAGAPCVCPMRARAPSGNRPSSLFPPSFSCVCVCVHALRAMATHPRPQPSRRQPPPPGTSTLARSLARSSSHRAAPRLDWMGKKATQLLRFEFSRAGTEPPSSPCCFLLYFLFSPPPPPPLSLLCRVALLCFLYLITSSVDYYLTTQHFC